MIAQMPTLRTFTLALTLALVPAATKAQAPDCGSLLARASMLVDRVAARDRAGPIADRARLCATLRLNRREMAEATGIMARCLTGHARAENVGQMQASIGDVDTVIARRCR